MRKGCEGLIIVLLAVYMMAFAACSVVKTSTQTSVPSDNETVITDTVDTFGLSFKDNGSYVIVNALKGLWEITKDAVSVIGIDTLLGMVGDKDIDTPDPAD